MSRKDRFKKLLRRAKALYRGDNLDFYTGYARGLRRAYYGDKFGSEEEHQRWLDFINSWSRQDRECGEGYLAGLAAMEDDVDGQLHEHVVEDFFAFSEDTGGQHDLLQRQINEDSR